MATVVINEVPSGYELRCFGCFKQQGKVIDRVALQSRSYTLAARHIALKHSNAGSVDACWAR